MKLIGNYLSPYTRRVAISLTALDMPFELELLTPFKKPEVVREHNPVVRIPTLVLDDGEALFESHVILDALDQLVGQADFRHQVNDLKTGVETITDQAQVNLGFAAAGNAVE